MPRYFFRVGWALSIMLNTLLLGHPTQTFSARNHAWKRAGRFTLAPVIDALLGRGHCRDSWIWWVTEAKTAATKRNFM